MSKKGSNEQFKNRQSPFSEGDNNRVIIAALQVKIKLYDDPLKFADKMEELVYKAGIQGASLVVFPEDNLSQLLGILPGISDNNGNINTTYQNSTAAIDEVLAGLGDEISISDILVFIGPFIKKISLIIFSELARKYKVFIMAGSGLFPDGNEYIDNGDFLYDKVYSCKSGDKKIYNIAYLFAPDGKLVGKQKKNHLLPLEDSWGLEAGEELSVYSTEIGRLAFPICMDATYFETLQIVSAKGAEIVMIPTANPDPDYNYWTALRGIWGRVQESPLFAIKSAMVGNFLGIELTGQAGVYAPLPLTVNGDGIIAESDSFDSEEIVIAELDLTVLRRYRRAVRNEVNRDFEEKYFPDIYSINSTLSEK